MFGVIWHGGHCYRAIAEQPMRPDVFQKRIGLEQHDHQNLDFPDQRRRVAQRQVFGQTGQGIGIPDQRQPPANRDHRGRGKERCALPQGAQ